MRIQHNIMAMNAYRNYNTNVAAMKSNLEKLSSGYKINRAGDDAAGLAISEKMRAQITGLNAAQKNVKDGISLVQTAEGAMQEVQDMLNRMVYLATQSANGTYDNEVDRANLQKELDQLRSEIDRISDSANFNGIKLLDGSKTSPATTYALDDSGMAELAKTKLFTDAAKPTQPTPAEISTATVHYKEAADPVKTKFEADLKDVTWNAKEKGEKLEISVGNYKVTLTAADAGEQDIAKLLKASAQVGVTNADVVTGTDAENQFKVDADGTKLVFELNGDPSKIKSDDALKPHWNVTLALKTKADAADDGTNCGTIVTGSNWNGGTKALTAGVKSTGTVYASTGITAANLGLAADAAANDGFAVTIQGKTFVLAQGDDSKWKDYNGSDVTVVKVGAADDEVAQMRALVNAINDNNEDLVWDAGMNAAGDLVLHQKVGTEGKTDAYDLTSRDGIAATLKVGKMGISEVPPTKAQKEAQPLTFQIGDTAESYNQLKVSIGDIHCKALGIDGISIAKQGDAQSAVQAIKDAINTVSSIRGDLGATQNRLEHTQNNLSVMQENITDAESSIRDTDVAEEMMAYTKNNILIQASQAMLAQANQVPQGVLQLLQ